MKNYEIFDCKGNEVQLDEVKVDVEYMYKVGNGVNFFITISKKNGEYGTYVQFGQCYRFILPNNVITRLTKKSKEDIIFECIQASML